ncbi:DUF2642 domain-containing protein [Scopulibacillus cellulosilyticus]|uniref:DUF2642 domain-containing protein n=1 Tax=Scopulibacillus cellulosilyticus TaxID=2665665 RepID=A0ABW2Q470_9BACL
MDNIKKLLNQQIEIEITGKTFFQGLLIDIGNDILVLYDGEKFYYIPLLHVHRIQLDNQTDQEINQPEELLLMQEDESISYRTVLQNAKGVFSEIYVTGDWSLHGYVTNVLSDYFVFYSPVYKTMLMSLHHLKWLTPYHKNITPYTLSKEALPVNPSSIPLRRFLEDELKRFEGKLVVFDIGENPLKIGLLKKIENKFIELVTANGETHYFTLNHIKSIHVP